MEVAHAQDDGARQWSRAHDILEDMRKKRASLEMGCSQRIRSQSPSSPTVPKLATLHEYEACETDRARELLDTMRKRRESFSKILIASSSPSSAKQSLTATDSTAALSWVSSSNDSGPEVFSEEGASNSYEDYFYDSDEGSTSGWSSSSSESTYTNPSMYESAGLRSILSSEQCVAEAPFVVRNIAVPGPLAAVLRNAVPLNQHHTLERKTMQTSRARNLYQEGRSSTSVKKSSHTSNQSHQFLERKGSATSRLRADLAAIVERRAMLTKMLQSVSELKNQEFDMASTILSVSTVSQSVDRRPSSMLSVPSVPSARRPPRPPPSKSVSEIGVPQAVYVSPSQRSRDIQPESGTESFGFPDSELRWGFDAVSIESHDDFNWEDALGSLVKDSQCGSGFYSDSKSVSSDMKDSQSGSMYYSDSNTGLLDDFPPLHILFKVEETKPKQSKPSKPARSANLKPVVRSIEDSPCGGLYQIAQLTYGPDELEAKWSSLKTGPRSPQMMVRDYTIPYNVEDRFCGGLYHIASLSSSPSRLAEF